MSNQAAHFFHTIPASADLSASYGCMVKMDNTGKAVLCGANSADAIGVTIDKPVAANQACPYQHSGLAEVKYGAVTAINDYLTTDASGRFVTATTGQKAYAKGHTVGAANKMGSAMLFGGGSYILAP